VSGAITVQGLTISPDCRLVEDEGSYRACELLRPGRTFGFMLMVEYPTSRGV
jgi:hypothetical protein